MRNLYFFFFSHVVRDLELSMPRRLNNASLTSEFNIRTFNFETLLTFNIKHLFKGYLSSSGFSLKNNHQSFISSFQQCLLALCVIMFFFLHKDSVFSPYLVCKSPISRFTAHKLNYIALQETKTNIKVVPFLFSLRIWTIPCWRLYWTKRQTLFASSWRMDWVWGNFYL